MCDKSVPVKATQFTGSIGEELADIVLSKLAIGAIEEVLRDDEDGTSKSGEVVNVVGRSLIEPEEENKQAVGNIVEPGFAAPVKLNNTYWSLSNSISFGLNKNLELNIGGIYLDCGFYKIKYNLSSNNEHPGSGLALFEPESRKFRELIFYKTWIKDTPKAIVQQGGSKDISVRTPCILGVTSCSGELSQSKYWGEYLISIYRLKIGPK